VETYNNEIAKNPNAELIHLSRDRDDETAEAWATKESMPWPTLMRDDTDVKTLVAPYFPDGRMGVPTYILVDRNGKEIARGKAAALAKIKQAAAAAE